MLSRPPVKDTPTEEWVGLLKELSAGSLAKAGSFKQQNPGTAVTQLSIPKLVGVELRLDLTKPATVSAVRDQLVADLLGRTTASPTGLPKPFGASHAKHVIRLVFARSPGGYKGGTKGTWRVVVSGAVAAVSKYQDSSLRTGWLVDALTDGSALTSRCGSPRDGCILWPASGATVKPAFPLAPINLSLTVVLDNNLVQRSRVQGFDFDSATATFKLYGVKPKATAPLAASYWIWLYNSDCYGF